MSFILGLTRLVLISVVALGATLGAAYWAMGFADGPMGMVRGGAFGSGEIINEDPDWAFIKDRETVEFQLLNPVSSRTSWVAEHNGRIFIPSGYMNTDLGKVWKHWPMHAEADGRALLRIDGKIYPRQLVRVTEDPDMTVVLAELSRKYIGQPVPMTEVSSGNLWVFELLPR